MRTLTTVLVLLLGTIVVPGLAIEASGSEESEWQPPPPMPDEYDWIKLTSGEWLKGELIDMFDDTLTFDSDKLKLLTLKWKDIVEIRSSGAMQVMITGRNVKIGQLLLQGDTVTMLGTKEQQFDRSEIIAITAGEPKEANYWSAKVTVGSNVQSGNSDLSESNAQVKIDRTTVRNRIRFDYLGNYNTASEVVTANNHRGSLGWDRFLTDRFFVVPAVGEYFRDPFQNIGHRLTLGTGVGYDLIDTSIVDWRVIGGPAYQETRFDNVVPGEPGSESTPAFVGSTNLEVEISSSLDFSYNYRFQLVNEASGTYNHHMVTGFELELTSLLDFDITFVWDRIKDPRPDSDGRLPDSDDFRLILGLGLDF
jgi:putative salt-induced outer membrane protein YdiY